MFNLIVWLMVSYNIYNVFSFFCIFFLLHLSVQKIIHVEKKRQNGKISRQHFDVS